MTSPYDLINLDTRTPDTLKIKWFDFWSHGTFLIPEDHKPLCDFVDADWA